MIIVIAVVLLAVLELVLRFVGFTRSPVAFLVHFAVCVWSAAFCLLLCVCYLSLELGRADMV